MASYTGTAQSHHAPDEVWRYLADLRSVADWDPSIDDARLVAGVPGVVGSRFEIEVSFLGGSITLPYETVEADAPHRVVFEAQTDSVSVRDEARISPTPGGSEVAWNADLQLNGPQRVLDLLLRVAFNRIGRNAEQGLNERLRQPVLTAGGETAKAA